MSGSGGVRAGAVLVKAIREGLPAEVELDEHGWDGPCPRLSDRVISGGAELPHHPRCPLLVRSSTSRITAEPFVECLEDGAKLGIG